MAILLGTLLSLMSFLYRTSKPAMRTMGFDGWGPERQFVVLDGHEDSARAQAVSQGGHISIGLGDYHYNEIGEPRNAELVERVVRIAREFGREVATPQEARAILGMH